MTKAQRSDFKALGTGYRWEATLFVTMWQEIQARYGKHAAREISTQAMKDAGLRFGRVMAEIWGKNDLSSLRDVWQTLYGESPENEWDEDRFVARGSRCIIKDTFDILTIPADLRADLDQMFCSADQAFVEGFNPDICFSFGARILRGDPACVWIMEKPVETA